MPVAMVFGVVLLAAVLVSERARRSVLSTAVLFLVAGALARAIGVLQYRPDDPLVAGLATVALFSVLFTDGMRAGLSDLRGAWRLPGRVLVLGLPVTLAITALLARLLVGLAWDECFLVAAALSPTDPVLAAAIVGRDEIPARVRHLLNVESGLNDGLALPVVLVLLARVSGGGVGLPTVAGELALGVALGIAVPLVAARLERLELFASSRHYQPLAAVAVAFILFGLTGTTHANGFLAAFAGGATVATVAPWMRHEFALFGELVSELFKLAALLVFGALLTPRMLSIGWGGWAFAVLALVVARPAAVWLSLLGSGVRGRELLTVAWFGPKGFASVVYGLLISAAAVPDRTLVFALVATTTVVSIVAHSSTDVIVARWFESAVADGDEDGDGDRGDGDRPGPGRGG